MFEYYAELLKVKDGDTIKVRLDLGCSTFVKESIRLVDIDAPEMTTRGKKKKEKAAAAKNFLIDLLKDAESIVVATELNKRGKEKKSFTRYIGTVWVDSKTVAKITPGNWLHTNIFEGRTYVNVNQLMLETGHAELYDK